MRFTVVPRNDSIYLYEFALQWILRPIYSVLMSPGTFLSAQFSKTGW